MMFGARDPLGSRGRQNPIMDEVRKADFELDARNEHQARRVKDLPERSSGDWALTIPFDAFGVRGVTRS